MKINDMIFLFFETIQGFYLHVYIKDECFPRPPLKNKLTDNFELQTHTVT